MKQLEIATLTMLKEGELGVHRWSFFVDEPNTTSGDRYATVIPIHRIALAEMDEVRLSISLTNVNQRSIYFVAGMSLETAWYEQRWPHATIARFPDSRFASVESYNRWLLTSELYVRFAAYPFIILCQTDALIVRHIPDSAVAGFDYLGAPWVPPWRYRWSPTRRRLVEDRGLPPRRELSVGNGGLSMRSTAALRRVDRLPRFSVYPNENVAISYFARRLGIKLAPTSVARGIFMELEASNWRAGDPVPSVLGYHALDKYNPPLEDLLIESHLRNSAAS